MLTGFHSLVSIINTKGGLGGPASDFLRRGKELLNTLRGQNGAHAVGDICESCAPNA
ncbi:hypothetical protein KYG_04045 [Acidovorax sp. NO-1]|nr:hypothetical protein KYG_04045 [Acidovorax sp. NO-1]